MPGLSPLTAVWFLFVSAGLVAGFYNAFESWIDYRAAIHDRRRLTRIEALHSLLTEAGRIAVQSFILAGAVVAILTTLPAKIQVGHEQVLQALFYLGIEVFTQALILNDFIRRRRLNGLAPAEWMRSALSRTFPPPDQIA